MDIDQIVAEIHELAMQVQPESTNFFAHQHRAKFRLHSGESLWIIQAISTQPFSGFGVINKQHIQPQINHQGLWEVNINDAPPDEYFFKGHHEAPIEVKTFNSQGQTHLTWKFTPQT